MVKTNKISNLKRLNFNSKVIVIIYLIKSIFKIKPSLNEISVYRYYNFLINSDGYVMSETDMFYISEFNRETSKIIKLRKFPSSDFQVYYQIYECCEYLPVVNSYKEKFKNYKDIELNIIDIGSNIGLTTLFFLEHFTNANVIAIEPEIENFKVLDFNLNSNYNKIKKIYGAIWYSVTSLKIVNDFRDKLDWSFRVEETEDANGIRATTINQIITENDLKIIDILKIDIEGSEKQLFNPELSNLDFLKITKCLAIEVHDEFECREDIYKILTKYNFEYKSFAQTTIAFNNSFK